MSCLRSQIATSNKLIGYRKWSQFATSSLVDFAGGMGMLRAASAREAHHDRTRKTEEIR